MRNSFRKGEKTLLRDAIPALRTRFGLPSHIRRDPRCHEMTALRPKVSMCRSKGTLSPSRAVRLPEVVHVTLVSATA